MPTSRLLEQFVVSVRDISDADVNALLEHASPEQVRSFVAALYAVEMGQRVDLVGSIVLTDRSSEMSELGPRLPTTNGGVAPIAPG